MPVPDSTDTRCENKPLKEFRALKSRYGGPLSKDHIPHIVEALRDIVPGGRYTSRMGLSPVCVVGRDYGQLIQGFSHAVVVFTSQHEAGEQRSSVEDFLTNYRFFATDCA